jgi:hypothetical protein
MSGVDACFGEGKTPCEMRAIGDRDRCPGPVETNAARRIPDTDLPGREAIRRISIFEINRNYGDLSDTLIW